jgi:hypothetical protein
MTCGKEINWTRENYFIFFPFVLYFCSTRFTVHRYAKKKIAARELALEFQYVEIFDKLKHKYSSLILHRRVHFCIDSLKKNSCLKRIIHRRKA